MKEVDSIKYNFFKNKFGLSTIVVTLILILLSIVAIGVVWGVVSGILNNASKEVGFEQFTISLDITNAYEYNGNIIVNLKRNVGSGQIVGLTFVLSDEGESETYTSDIPIGELESKKYTIPVSQFNSTDIDEVSVAPRYESSGEEKLGSILDTFEISESYTGSTPPDEENGEIIPLTNCTANCTNLVCGPDPVCGVSCGNCENGFNCLNGMCVSSSCVPDSNETTCGASVCGTKLNNCGAFVDCGTCSFGQICSDGVCNIISPVNSGSVEDLWPGNSGMYFGSSSLPTDTSYVGYYAKFPGSAETSCLLIVLYRFPIDGYAKSHVGFSFGTALQVGDTYNIYETIDGCSL